MEFIDDEFKMIMNSLIKASNLSETEWLNLEKVILKSYSTSNKKITKNNVQNLWNRLYQKVEKAKERMKLKS